MNSIQRLSRFFFCTAAERNTGLSRTACYLLPILVFGLARLLTIATFDHRGIDPLKTDAQGYMATARYVVAHGHLPDIDDQLYRQFPGLSFLIIPTYALLHDYTLAGEAVTALSGLACIVLVQYLFDDVRISVLSAVFLPWAIIAGVGIASEWPTCLCFLLGVWTMRDARRWSPLYVLGLLAAGYSLVLRPSALFLIMPFLALWAWREPRGGFRHAVMVMAVASMPYLACLGWNWLSIRQLFPEQPLQQELLQIYRREAVHPECYSWHLLGLPGQSLLGGLADPSAKLVKKALTVVIIPVYLLALIRLGWLARCPREDDATRRLALALGGALLGTLAFHLCVGGNFGFKAFGRYLLVANTPVLVGLFYQRPLRWCWIVPLALVCLLYACLTGGDNALFTH